MAMQKQITAYSAELKDAGWMSSAAPLGTVCELIYCIGAAFQLKPQIYVPKVANELWISFPEASLQCDDFFEDYGGCLASLCRTYPVSVCGFSDFLEEGELSVSLSEDGEEDNPGSEWGVGLEEDERKSRKIFCIKKNISGRNFEILSAVWIKIRFQRKMEVEFTSQVIKAINLQQKAAAVCARWVDVFPEKELFEETGMSYFRYILFSEVTNPIISTVSCLTVPQMKELWLHYLVDRKDTLEFELLYENLEEIGEVQRRGLMTALRLALAELRIRIEYACGEFRVMDDAGGRLWFDFGSRFAAEKLFLKLIFPVSPER